MKQKFRNELNSIAGNYEGPELTRVKATLLTETMFGALDYTDKPVAPQKMRRDVVSVHEIILVPTDGHQARIDKDLEKQGFRIDSISQNADISEQYATVYYNLMERHVNWSNTLDQLQEYGPLECAFIPVYLDINGARVLVYSQTSAAHNAEEIAKLRDDFLKNEMPKFFKAHQMKVEAVNEIYKRKEK